MVPNAGRNNGYGSRGARFVDQIMIKGGSVSAAGDSGSLIVTQRTCDPVGLLFAGGSGATFANPIGRVLEQTGTTIDGQQWTGLGTGH